MVFPQAGAPDLIEQWGTTCVTRSLQTADRTEAMRRLHVEQVEFDRKASLLKPLSERCRVKHSHAPIYRRSKRHRPVVDEAAGGGMLSSERQAPPMTAWSNGWKS